MYLMFHRVCTHFISKKSPQRMSVMCLSKQFRSHQLSLQAQGLNSPCCSQFLMVSPTFLGDGLQCRREYEMSEAFEMKGKSQWKQCVRSFEKWRQESTRGARLKHNSNWCQIIWIFSLFYQGFLKWLDNYIMLRCHSGHWVFFFY